ncbi:PIR protein [Plasmodium ovale]|uniref:PIR Superfamily Protein n=2 Tax=Plasmodium ovale TaxID=36330 RepID=A0A1A8WJU0_PLAOA|nr:PIR Superfamily Protein [Plasmodium ovale curtisi]SBT84214.1 PIR protein [Plasmodium ovale]
MILETQTDNKLPSPYSDYKKELDNYISDSDTQGIYGCNEFRNQHLSGSKYGAVKTCTMTIKFLFHLKERNVSSYQEYGCKYLFYWLYFDALESKKSIENTLDLYREINVLYNREHDGDNKFNKYISKMNNDTFEKVKKIIHIYDVFNQYTSQVKSEVPGTKCTSSCVELFNSYADECREVYDYDFCNKLTTFGEQYNFFIRKIRECEGEEYLLPPVHVFDATSVIIIPFSLMFVTSSILSFLYKFTAFGPWIRRLIWNKKNMWENSNKQRDQSLNTCEIRKNNSKKPSYNISYNLS